MTPFWNNPTKHIARPLTVGFVSPLQAAPAQPRVIVCEAEADRRITSIDQLGSIWQWESHLTWVVPDFLAEGSVNLISSASGTGKTWLAYFLAGAVAHGWNVFGEQVKQRKVLYLDGENPAYVVKQRLYDLGIPETQYLDVWGGWHPDPPPGPGQPIIQDFAAKEKPLLIWDSLVEFHTGDEQSSNETRDFMRQFRRLAHLGATVVVLHHTGKSEMSQEYRGSSDIKAVVDMAFLLKKEGKGQALDQLTLEPFKSRLAVVPTRLLKYVRGKGFDSTTIAKPVADGPDPVEVIKRIVETSPGLNQSQIVKRVQEEAEIGKHKIAKLLEREDVFRTERGKRNENLYYLVEQAVPVQEEVPAVPAEPELPVPQEPEQPDQI
ncbi:MAG TPA: AAA family ATPase [Bryobacteraceae bacterium]|nr:AAA family ATPase [Bryobacteraceae bacterium]